MPGRAAHAPEKGQKGLEKRKKGRSGFALCCTAYAMSSSSKVSQRSGGNSPFGASLKPTMPGDAATRFKIRSDRCTTRKLGIANGILNRPFLPWYIGVNLIPSSLNLSQDLINFLLLGIP